MAQVTRPGGIYISQHKQPVSLQASLDPNERGRYEIENTYYRTDPIPCTDSKAETLSDYGKRVRSNLFTAGSSSLVVFAGPIYD